MLSVVDDDPGSDKRCGPAQDTCRRCVGPMHCRYGCAPG